MEALRLSMFVVADDSATNETSTQVDDEIYRTSGPKNPNSTVGSVKQGVDCRGHLYTDDQEVVALESVQRAVVGSWLLVKEGAACLAKLVQLLPAPTVAGSVVRCSTTSEIEIDNWQELSQAIHPYIQLVGDWEDTSGSPDSILSSTAVCSPSASSLAAIYSFNFHRLLRLVRFCCGC